MKLNEARDLNFLKLGSVQYLCFCYFKHILQRRKISVSVFDLEWRYSLLKRNYVGLLYSLHTMLKITTMKNVGCKFKHKNAPY